MVAFPVTTDARCLRSTTLTCTFANHIQQYGELSAEDSWHIGTDSKASLPAPTTPLPPPVASNGPSPTTTSRRRPSQRAAGSLPRKRGGGLLSADDAARVSVSRRPPLFPAQITAIWRLTSGLRAPWLDRQPLLDLVSGGLSTSGHLPETAQQGCCVMTVGGAPLVSRCDEALRRSRGP